MQLIFSNAIVAATALPAQESNPRPEMINRCGRLISMTFSAAASGIQLTRLFVGDSVIGRVGHSADCVNALLGPIVAVPARRPTTRRHRPRRFFQPWLNEERSERYG